MIFSKEFKSYFEDASEVEVGDFRKHDACFATRELVIDAEVIAAFPELALYAGHIASQEGTQSYSYGWESYDDIKLFKLVSKETQQAQDFWRLMDHLNSEDNDMAHKFNRKYHPERIVREEVTTGILPTIVAMAKAGSYE
ncbi:hypothetical protein [Pectobacterium phage Jarilo]|uniref:Uncharacterized protein n=1 Tax=Pectobacterium phage Jarilo TaxID=2163634 RepID=A0A2S1GSY8_9CAUD|nr:hypothetical protein HOT17_gp26 [Pectobacterium phage Jarilo]AWD92507.1 hypothetical protein [Pectobacterium phage Jarilo]